MPPAAVEVATLVGHGGLSIALRCLGSLARHSEDPVAIRIHDDGTLTEADVASLRDSLPIARVVPRDVADGELGRALRDRPACRRLRDSNVLALKLFDIAHFAEGTSIDYVDSDVLFLRPFRGLFEAAPRAVERFFPDSQSAYSLRARDLGRLAGRPIPRRANSGLIRFPIESFDLDFLESFLGSWRGFAPMWIEQTCWALLTTDTRLLSPRQAAIHGQHIADPRMLVALHFVSSVRSALSGFSTPDRSGDRPADLEYVVPERLTRFELLRDGLRRRFSAR